MKWVISTTLLFICAVILVVKAHTVNWKLLTKNVVTLEYTLDAKNFNGIAFEKHTNGKLYKIAPFWRGMQFGTEYRWYPSGNIFEEIPYKDGLPHGTYKQWFENGKPKYLKHYVKGVRDGEIWGWHSNGTVSDYHVFKNGEQTVYKSFIADGKPFYNYVIRENERIGLNGGRFCKTKK